MKIICHKIIYGNFLIKSCRITPVESLVQISSFFWFVFSHIRTEYGVLGSKYPYSVRIREKTDQKKLSIWTFFTQWRYCKYLCKILIRHRKTSNGSFGWGEISKMVAIKDAQSIKHSGTDTIWKIRWNSSIFLYLTIIFLLTNLGFYCMGMESIYPNWKKALCFALLHLLNKV